MKRIITIFLSIALLFIVNPTGSCMALENEIPLVTNSEIKLNVTTTDIEADSVINCDGYGSLQINGLGDIVWENQKPRYTKENPKYALIDQNGNFVFEYKTDTHILDRYSNISNTRYIYSDDFVYEFNSGYLVDDKLYSLDGQVAYEIPSFFSDYTFSCETDESCIVGNKDKYSSIIPFSDGISVIREKIYISYQRGVAVFSSEDVAWYLVNKSGEITYVFPKEYNSTTGATMDYIYKTQGCGEGLIGVYTVDYEYSNIGKWIDISELLFYIDCYGNVVLTPQGYSWGGKFCEGLAIVKSRENGKYGFINKNGEEIINCQFDAYIGYGFNNGYAGVKFGDKYGYIDKMGNVVIPFEYDDAYGAGEGLFSVVKDGKCGIVDENNNVVLPFEYDDISSFNKGVCYAVKDGKLYILTRSLLIGDGNGDNTVDVKDLVLLKSVILCNGKYDEALDADGDGDIDVLDIMRMKKYFAYGTPLGKNTQSVNKRVI